MARLLVAEWGPGSFANRTFDLNERDVHTVILTHERLQSVAGPGSPSRRTTIFTGVCPARHSGIYCYERNYGPRHSRVTTSSATGVRLVMDHRNDNGALTRRSEPRTRGPDPKVRAPHEGEANQPANGTSLGSRPLAMASPACRPRASQSTL